jgi:ABC-2 type transport system ATP-binding protein
LGPNGAGKTTTMNILTGYISASAGTVKVAGVDVLEDPISAKRHIGYLPEQPPLYPDMTVDEYLGFVYELKGVKAVGMNEHIESVLNMVGVADVRKRLIKNLSKGYKQRVGLAQALVGDPDVLILDEPTVGLDPRQIIEIRNVIRDLGRERTIILSSHILPEVSAVCERVLVISNGQIVADDKPENLSKNVSTDRRLVIRIAGEREKLQNLLRAQDGVKSVVPLGELEAGAWDFDIECRPNMDVRRPLFMTLAQAGCPILLLKPQGASLEEVFLALTTEDGGETAAEQGGETL